MENDGSIIVLKDHDFLICEKIVKAFNEYKIDNFEYNVLVRVLYFSETDSYYPIVYFADYDLDPKKTLAKDFEELDFDNVYNAGDPVITVDDELEYGDYEDDCCQDMKSVFNKIYNDYQNLASITAHNKEQTEALEQGLIKMKNDLFIQIFGSDANVSE